MTKTKKIIIFVIVAAVLGALAYWFFTRPTASDQPGENNGGGFSLKNFLPFGTAPEDSMVIDNENDLGNSNNLNNAASSTVTNVPVVKLRELSERPVAGAVIFSRATSTVVRFVEKANGNVYEVRTDSPAVTRISNETIPKIMRSFWLGDGSGFLAQTVDDNENIYTSFILLTSSGAEKSDLPTGIQEIAVSPDSKKIFYLTDEAGASGYLSNPDGTKATLVFSNPLSEWLPHWYGTNSILLSSYASLSAPSYGLILNPNTKSVSSSYSGITGASALPSTDGKYVILGSGGIPTLSLYNPLNSSVVSSNAKTLPEKCTWDKTDTKFIFCAVPKQTGGIWPDAWYKGTVSTNDLIERINIFDSYFYILNDLSKESQQNIDAYNLQSSKDGEFVIFTNKIDSSLWLLDVN